MICAARVTRSDKPARNEFRVRVERDPCPNAARALRLLLARAVAVLRENKTPNFVTLDALAFQVHENLVLIIRARATEIAEKFNDGVFRNSRHSDRRAHAVALN